MPASRARASRLCRDRDPAPGSFDELRLLPGSELDRTAARWLKEFCTSENPELFRRLFERTGPGLLSMLRAVLRRHRSSYDPVELLTDTFAQIYRARHSFRDSGSGSFLRWFLTIAQNLVRQDHRESLRRGRREISSARSIVDESANPVQCLVREENAESARRTCRQLQESVLAGFHRLSLPNRRVVLLHSVYGWKYREIAERLGLTLSAVAMRMKRSRDRILEHVLDQLEARQAERAPGPPA